MTKDYKYTYYPIIFDNSFIYYGYKNSTTCSWTDRGFDPVVRTIGDYQNDAFQGHQHNSDKFLKDNGGLETGFALVYSDDAQEVYFMSISVGNPVIGGYGTPRISNETRPDNVAVSFIINY